MEDGAAASEVADEDFTSGRVDELDVAAAGLAVDVEANLSCLLDVVFGAPSFEDESSTLTSSCRRTMSFCIGSTGNLRSYTISPG